MKYKVGDMVQHVIGGPVMVIDSVVEAKPGEDARYVCERYEEASHMFLVDNFAEGVLQKPKPAEKVKPATASKPGVKPPGKPDPKMGVDVRRAKK